MPNGAWSDEDWGSAGPAWIDDFDLCGDRRSWARWHDLRVEQGDASRALIDYIVSHEAELKKAIAEDEAEDQDALAELEENNPG